MPNPSHAYNVIKGTNPGYIWFRVPKVGSSSLRKMLHEYTTVEEDSFWLPISGNDMANRYTFAFVRNPFNRLVSTWHDKVVQTETKEKKHYLPCFDKDFTFFVNFICEQFHNLPRAEPHVRPQTYFIPDNIDFLGHLESFTEDLPHVLQNLGLQEPVIPHLKTWPRPHYSTYYTAETRAMMEHYYREDIVRFGYHFETPPAGHDTPS